MTWFLETGCSSATLRPPMTRIRLLTSGYVDADCRAHTAAIAALQGADVNGPTHVEDSLPLIAAAAARLFKERRRTDVVVSFGEAALTAVSLGWQGPSVHVASGALSRGETSLTRRLARGGSFRLVTASAATARLAARTISDARDVRIVRPESLPATLDRAAARERLGIAQDAPVAFIPGISRRGNTHRLALWATGILAFRDPAFRVLISGGGGDAMIRRFAKSTQQSRALILNTSMADADLARAADVAVFDGRHLTEWSPLAAAVEAGTPIVALGSLWRRERLQAIAASIVNETKPRWLAIEILRALGRGRSWVDSRDARSTGGTEWVAIFEDVAGTPSRV